MQRKYCFRLPALALGLLACVFSANAQFVPTSSPETTYPGSAVNPIVINPSTTGLPPYAIPGLYNNAHMSTYLGSPGDPVGTDAQIAEVTAWTEADGSGWENGHFTYGYTTSSGVYVPTGTIDIPGAKYLHAAYMTNSAGSQGYIVAAYVTRQINYIWTIVSMDMSTTPWTPIYGWYPIGSWMYDWEYRIYNWSVPTATATLATRGFLHATPNPYLAAPSPGTPLPHPNLISSGPLAPGYDGVFPHEGTLVMDVSKDAKRIAFAHTMNGQWIETQAGEIVGTTSPSLSLSAPMEVAKCQAKNPVDLAFRRDASLVPPTDFYHILFDDGSGSYAVAQMEFDWVTGISLLYPPRVDDANSVSASCYDGTYLYSSLADHLKLDVPDESSERKWAYTWSDGSKVYLRRYSAPTSMSPATGIGSSVTQVINDGSLTDPGSTPIVDISGATNDYPTVSYKANTPPGVTSIFVGWNTHASVPYTGAANFVGVEVTEDPVWTNPPVVTSAMDYLDIQSTNNLSGVKSLAFSKHNQTTADLLYTSFVQDDGAYVLQHKNHLMSAPSTWRKANPSVLDEAHIPLTISPNPFQSKLRLTGNGVFELRLTDLTGRQLGTWKGDVPSLNISLNQSLAALPSGLYLLQSRSDKGIPEVFKLEKTE